MYVYQHTCVLTKADDDSYQGCDAIDHLGSNRCRTTRDGSDGAEDVQEINCRERRLGKRG